MYGGLTILLRLVSYYLVKLIMNSRGSTSDTGILLSEADSYFYSFFLFGNHLSFVENQMSYVRKFRRWAAQLNLFTEETDESPNIVEKQLTATNIFFFLLTGKHI